MPNGIAYLALLLWPFACLVFARTMSIERAVIWSLIGGYLLLPPVANFDLPGIPPIDKISVPSISLIMVVMFSGNRFSLIPKSKIAIILLAGFILTSIPTVLTNFDPVRYLILEHSDPITYTAWMLPGLGSRDIISALTGQLIILLPFLFARQFLATEHSIRALLLALIAAMLAYSVPALIEIRLSPQMNVWVYGFFQHEFVQTMRGGGFRPLVFLEHPLWLAFFVVSSVLAVATMVRHSGADRKAQYIVGLVYLIALLFLCRSLASFAYGICLLPIILFFSTKFQIKISLFFALVAVSYPLLRGNGYIPVEEILGWAEAISSERAASLAFRFETETMLLERASEKPWLGWGGWGRNLIHDVETGQLLTVPDGRWIIAFGTYGWFGYVFEFGLLSLPIFLIAYAALGKNAQQISPFAATIVLILAINMIDMLLNAALTPITWMLAGASLGYAESLKKKSKSKTQFQLKPAIGQLDLERPTKPVLQA